MTPSFLNHIRHKTLERIPSIQIKRPLARNTLNFCEIFQNTQQPTIIAEIKFATPKSGPIYPGHLDPVSIATEYFENGAQALSILTEPHYFKGHIEYVQAIRAQHPQSHLLLKDFILHPVQLEQACQAGANAVLLIVAFLEQPELERLYHDALALGLTPLIEVHNSFELERALELNPRMIGINNRHLGSLEIDLNTSYELIQSLPQKMTSTYFVCESGINTREQINSLQDAGFNAFLIGSHFMRSPHPGQALQSMLGEHHAH